MEMLNKFTNQFRADIEGVREEVITNQMYVRISLTSSVLSYFSFLFLFTGVYANYFMQQWWCANILYLQ